MASPAVSSELLPSEFVVSARVKCAWFAPRWVSRRRWVVLRGSKSPVLSVYARDPRRLEGCAPVRMLLLGEDTKMDTLGEKALVLVSSRVRRDDTLCLEFESFDQRQLVFETLRRWVALAMLLQRLLSHESIAKGPNSMVYLCHDHEDPDKRFVLKRIHHSRCQSELSVTARVMALSQENRELAQYIAQYFYMFEDRKAESVTVVMKHYPGGTLADRIKEKGPFSEAVAAKVLLDLCRALSLLHENHVLHLDVKASNILFDDPSDSLRHLKLVDFGSGVCVDNNYSCSAEKTEKLASAGTYGCMAPERFEGYCGPEADVYGAGVVLYHMLSGVIPFTGADTYQLLVRNMKGDVGFEEKSWQYVSTELKSLTARMLDKDATKRITLEEILHLPWLSQEPESIDVASSKCSEIIEPEASSPK